MENVMLNGFADLSLSEMDIVNGGGVGAALVCICAGAIGVIAGPPAVITGTVAVGCWYVGSALIGIGGVVGALGY